MFAPVASQHPAAFSPEPLHGPIRHTGAHAEPPITCPSSGEDHTQGLVTFSSEGSHAQGVVAEPPCSGACLLEAQSVWTPEPQCGHVGLGLMQQLTL